MPTLRVTSLDHPDLAPYCQLKHTNRTRWTGQFIAEGKKLTVQLLQSDFRIHSVLATEKEWPRLEPLVAPEVPVFIIAPELAEQLIGFDFHCGLMGCGYRKPQPRLADLIPTDGPARIVVCPKIENPDNLGSIVRLSAGFGVHAILLGHGSVDPFLRRAVRVSMGGAFQVPILEVGHELDAPLKWLREERGVELVATVLDKTAEPLKHVPPLPRCGLLFGNEHNGLGAEWVDLCQRRVMLPMADGTDSLNVAFAAGIFMYHFFG